MKKQIGWINIAKGIAIVLVVYGHVLDGLNAAGYEIWNYQLIHDIIYAFHMPLFFFLSGIFAKKLLTLDLTTILKTRSVSLLHPYFLWGTIQAGIMVFLSKYTNGNIGVERLLQLPIRPIGQFWYIYDLFFITLLYYIICRKFKKPFNQFGVISILFLSSFYISFWEYDRIAFHLFYFYLGSEILNSLKNWQEKWGNTLFGGLIVLVAYSFILHLLGTGGGGGVLA